MSSDWLTWIGIVLCLTQSAMFSGLNLAFFSVSRLRLEAEAQSNPQAAVVLAMRGDSNFLLTTILWGNVTVNTLLALLSNSMLTGVLAFVFSTLVITFFGEICPQAFFSRRALPTAARFAPLIRLYQLLLYPLAKPSALMLDLWLGREAVQYMREKTLRHIILQHLESEGGEIDVVEGLGAMNFMDIDDMMAGGVGQEVAPDSVITLPLRGNSVAWPHYQLDANDPFLRNIHASGRKWIIFTDPQGQPRLVLNADEFLRDVWFKGATQSPERYCHRPIVVTDARTPLGDVIALIKHHHGESDGPIAQDIALLWSNSHRRVITGTDILGTLLRGIRGAAAPAAVV